jgi:protein-L-isoaspartate(D-aspartate) O-methyltransferase
LTAHGLDDVADDRLARERRTMIDSQLRTVGIIAADVLAAMAEVPRERFVPAALAGLAYADAGLEVAPGRWLYEPMALGLLLQNARVSAADRVLIIGAASGYSAAVMRHIGARVTAVESDPALLAIAAAAGVAVEAGDLAAGWPAGAPYDLLFFDGAIESVPAALAAQLGPGGRAAAVVRRAGVGHAIVGPLVSAGAGLSRIGGLPFLEVAAKALPGFVLAPAFAF